jgi:hypothetical protein
MYESGKEGVRVSWEGIIIGAIVFCVIGLFHGITVKGEYHFSERIWPIFLVVGIAAAAVSLWVRHTVASAALAIFGFTCLWTIGELKKQTERVRKGWFPANPKRLACDREYELSRKAELTQLK